MFSAINEEHLHAPPDSTTATISWSAGFSSSTILQPVYLGYEETQLIQHNYDQWQIILEPSDLNSIGLSRLFAKLRIEPPDNLAMLLPPAQTENAPMKSRLFNCLVIDLTKFNDENCERTEMYQGEESRDDKNGHSFSHHKDTVTPFKNPGVDFLFPFERPICPSPWNELYPFPEESSPSPKNPAQRILPSRAWTHISYVRRRESEYKDKLVKLSQVCLESHPAMVKTMETLGDLYYSMGKMSLAEHWYRRVITARQRRADTNSVEALQGCLNLIHVITLQGRYVEAKTFHQETYLSILDKFGPNHKLAQQSLHILVCISTFLHDYEEAEEYSRQLLRLRLNAFGPLDERTLGAMQILAMSLRNRDMYDECEDLLRIVLQLQERLQDTSGDIKCLAIATLANALFYRGHYKGSRPLFKQATELAENSLGGDHPCSLYCNYLLARDLHNEGLHTESKKLLEASLGKQIILLGETHIDTTSSMSELGEVFMDTGHYEEAAIWLEKAFRSDKQVYGAHHNYSMSSCDALGICYEKQERYTDAVALYEQAMQEITATKGSGHPALVKLQGWVEVYRNRLVLERRYDLKYKRYREMVLVRWSGSVLRI